MVVPAAVAIATANPMGLIVVGAAKLYGENEWQERTLTVKPRRPPCAQRIQQCHLKAMSDKEREQVAPIVSRRLHRHQAVVRVVQ